MFDKKRNSCVKRIYLVTDDGLYDWKAFYAVKIVFIYPPWMMANLSIINWNKVMIISLIKSKFLLKQLEKE